MFKKTSLQDWESVVQKQMKTENIYEVLSKENLEGIIVKPYYDSVTRKLPNLPKVEESTHLVSLFQESDEDSVFAFLLNQNVEDLKEKILFINDKKLAEHIIAEDENRYISLIDVFPEDSSGELNGQLAKELLAKNFERNLAIDISLHQNAGASIIQQLATALSKIKDLVEIFGEDLFTRLTIRLAVGSNYFFEIAKIRALKLLYNQLSKEYGLDDIPFLFAETTMRNKSVNDAENNLIRSALELSAAMIGGADAVFSNDFRINDSQTLSQEMSFKQQIVLAYESIINVFDDGANGSYYIEEITVQFAENAWNLFLEMENEGGYCALLKSGKLQREICTQGMKEQQWVEEGRIKLVGVNMYPKLDKIRTTEELYRALEIKPVRLAEMFE